MHRNTCPHAPQRGIATVLILLLVGLSLSVAALGTAHYIRSQQKQDIATHALTQAQMKAWTGAELVRQYLQKLQTDNQLSAFYASVSVPSPLTLTGEGVTGAMLADIAAIDATAGTVTARITGITAPNSPAEARAVLEVVYAVGAAPSQCGTPRRTSTVLRGDVSITGGTTSFTSGANYTDLAIDGSLTIQSASQATISGCTKGDINMSGGGIDDNAVLFSEGGSIKIEKMSAPNNASIWAKSIDIKQYGGSYQSIQAGAYDVRIMVGNDIAGTARIGGTLIPETAGTALPWVTGTVKPWRQRQLMTLADGGQYLVDLSQARVDDTTGLIVLSDRASALEKVNDKGASEFPDSFTLVATNIWGGDIEFVSVQSKLTWGHELEFDGGSGNTFDLVKANGSLEIDRRGDTIKELIGGGNFLLKQAQYTEHQWWTEKDGFPAVKGDIAGTVTMKNGAKLPDAANIDGFSVRQKVANLSPGLPGEPFCDTRTDTFDAAAFRSSANYIFEFDASGKPRLTIQHMKASNGTSIDRAGIDLTAVDPDGTAPGAMVLRRINGVDFLGCNYQSPNNQYSDALACLRNATPANGWRLNGITKFPPGIALFIGPVTIDGVDPSQGTLTNTILSTGGVTLTGSEHGPLVAPNFASPLSSVCDGPFYPANLCDKKATPSSLAKWTDAEGREHAGLPLANLAIGTNKQLNANSWDAPNGITGNVLLGEGISTGGGTLNIAGSLTVGANVRSATTITQGGLKTNTTRLTQDQGYLPLPSGNCTPTATPQAITMKWSRYL